jgi:hypothetical protein
MHPEVPIKVNVWVDGQVAPLVAALNQFDQVMTVDSCQGGEGRPAHVLFRHVGGEKAGAAFFFRLGKALSEKAAPVCQYDFRLQWLTGQGEPLAEIYTDPDTVSRLATAVAAVATAFRKKPSRRGSRGRAPRSSIRCPARPRTAP